LKRLEHGTAEEKCAALSCLGDLGAEGAAALPAVLAALRDNGTYWAGAMGWDRSTCHYVRLAAIHALFRIVPEQMSLAREAMIAMRGKPHNTHDYVATPEDTFVEFSDAMWVAAGGKP
jgi:hypothetical protein